MSGTARPPPIPKRPARSGLPTPARSRPAEPTAPQTLVDHAYASLRRLAAAEPLTRTATTAAEEIERVHLAGPFTAAIAGEPGPRAAFLGFLAGTPLFAADRQPPDDMVLSLRRGPVTLCRARHRDGSVEELRMPAAAAPEPVEDPHAEARRELARREAGLATAQAQLPLLLRSRPPWWALWLWVMRWVLSLRHRHLLAGMAAEAGTLASWRHQLDTGQAPDSLPPEDSRQRFIETVRALADARGRGNGVERLFIEIADGPMPENVVILEMRPGAGADSLEHAGVDAVLVVGGITPHAMETPLVRAALDARGRIFFTGDPATAGNDDRLRPLGGVAAACAGLPRLLLDERALRLTRRAAQVLDEGQATLAASIARAETDFGERIARLEKQRVTDPEAVVTEHMNRALPMVVERIHQLIQQVTVELGADVARMANEWQAQLAASQSTDALRAAGSQLDAQSPAALQAARDEAQMLLGLGLRGAAHDLYPQLLGDLPRVPGETVPPPSPLPVELSFGEAVPGTHLGSAAPWLRSLFKSLERTRAEALGKLADRVKKLEQVASAVLLDAEPQMLRALCEPLALSMRAALERHAAWLDTELAGVRAAIEAERARLQPLVRAHDTAVVDSARLADLAAGLGG